MSDQSRYDFIVVKPNPGTDPAVIETTLAAALGAKPEKIGAVLKHLAEKGPVTIEKAVSRERLDQLKRIWETAGVATTSKQSLGLVDVVVEAKPVSNLFKCPSCGHEQEPKTDSDQCGKCGVFAGKFLDKQKKDEVYLREKEKLEKIHGFRKMKEDKEAREAAEQAEIDAVRKRIEEEMGVNKKARGGWLGGTGVGPTFARTAIGGTVLAVLVLAGVYGRDLIGPRSITSEDLAKQQQVQAKQQAAQMQNMVGNLIQGSKKAAQASGAAAQFQQALFNQGGKDAELTEGLEAVQAGGAGSNDSLSGIDRAEGLASASKAFVESGGSPEDAERALAVSMQSAKQIKEGPQRAEAVSAVAAVQLEVHSQNAREKAASGDWRAADKSFAKALTAASEVTSASDLVTARSTTAKVRADTGDYSGATILFMDAMKAAEALPDPRARALAISDVARQMAQSTNEIEGAAERGFEKALSVATLAKQDPTLASEILLRRVQATCEVATFMLSTDATAGNAKPVLVRAGKDLDQITDPFLLARAIGTYARTRAEYEGETEEVNALLARAAKLSEVAAEPVRESLVAVATRARVETLAAAAKRIAGKGEKAKAKQAFLVALKSANSIATKSADPTVRSEVAKQRTEALGELARYMRSAGDKEAAAKVFQLALKSADPAQAPKVVSWMVRNSRGG